MQKELCTDRKGEKVWKEDEVEWNYALPMVYIVKEMRKLDNAVHTPLQVTADPLISNTAVKTAWEPDRSPGIKIKDSY